ncbi:MAG: 50S ribosomal protein L1 [Candidatus Omnitrophica bacterium]|nr:50S ribosomal protein L1 [Candidatus Omnitrophota bacterium]
MTLTKRAKNDKELIKANGICEVPEAVDFLKKATAVKFDASVDMQLKLNADANASDQLVRGTTALPHGTGKVVRVVVLTRDESGKAAKEAGADEVGGDELVEKIMKGWLEFDVVVATPSMMKDIAKLGRVLGPRGLMPSPKAGTVTDDVENAVKEIKKGRIEYKMDKQSNLHSSIGRMSFTNEQLIDNAKAFVNAIQAARPKTIKGDFIKAAHLSSTMGPGIKLDLAGILREGAKNE